MSTNELFMQRAIELSRLSMNSGKGGPFGAVIVKGGKIVGEGSNNVTSKNDPSAHAEIEAIRQACQGLKNFDLSGCEIYTSCEPCPMCLSAIYWARISKVYFGNTKTDAAKIQFDDAFIYQEISTPIAQRKIPMNQLMQVEAQKIFADWDKKSDKIPY
jgi:tRNA(Arg) A34 adenosine deaminase TadA